tara:strand:+ start:1822 stop:2028 length:207 start_codon:yes stop_codon:yes gene_type:complete
MKKLLAIVVLALFFLSNCSSNNSTEDLARDIKKALDLKEKKSMNCKKEIKDISGANAVEAYEKCMKRK